MISITMYKEKWRIQIGDEIWQFENIEDLKKNLNILLDLKDKYGKINKEMRTRYE